MKQNSGRPKRKREPVNVNRAPTGRERREPADSLEFFSDSPEQIEESIKRTGLRSRLDEAFRAAIKRVKRSPRRKH